MRPQFRTVAEAIAEIGKLYPQHGYVFQDLDRQGDRVHLRRRSSATPPGAAPRSSRYGLVKGDRLGIVVIEPEDFVLTFLAAVRVGVVPVPLYPPMSFGNLDAYADRTARVLESAGAKLLLASARLQNVLWGLVDRVSSLERLVVVEKLAEHQRHARPGRRSVPEDLAFLQYTCGSTADPKGVMVTHAYLVANARAIITTACSSIPRRQGRELAAALPRHGAHRLRASPRSVHGVPVVFIPTIAFVKRPSVWLDTIHRHRGTITFAPELRVRARRQAGQARRDLASWDLSCLRVARLRRRADPGRDAARRSSSCSRRRSSSRSARCPRYGMAEATLAITLQARSASS